MANYLKAHKRQQVISLLELGWSYRRIESETGVRRETVSRYDGMRRSKAAKGFPGSVDEESCPIADSEQGRASNPAKEFPGSVSKAAKGFAGSSKVQRSSAHRYRDEIVAMLEKGLTAKRIWQDLVEDFGYGHGYEAVKRYVRRLRRRRGMVGVMHSAPGEEGQVDFFRGAPTLDPSTGQWRRPWVFRMTLCHSRHGYEEAVWDQRLETFLRLHERAFRALEGVVRTVRHDNLKAAVVRACLYDPETNVVYAAFAEHWGFTPLPTRPRNPKENGKQERSGGYVKSNALKGRRFNSLEEQNAFLRRWNRTIARLRIHGTTKKQVWAHYLETDKPALRPLKTEAFPLFECGQRIVFTDGHVEVKGSYYPAPTYLLGEKIQVRWDQHMVRLFHHDELVAAHCRVPRGRFAHRAGDSPEALTSTQEAGINNLLRRCGKVGAELRTWAELAIEERGIRALRLIQGALSLTRKHSREQVLRAATKAAENRLFRFKDLKRLAEMGPAELPLQLTVEHSSIRPMTDYRMEDFLS